jgi:hypothetical protein
MAKHLNRKFVSEVIGCLKKNGFNCEYRKGKYIISNGNGPAESFHSGMSAYHPLRRWLNKTYDFNLDEEV